jgi:hypothetical protein
VTLVPQVDRDGNDLGGIELPHLQAPLGTQRINSEAWMAASALPISVLLTPGPFHHGFERRRL